MKKTMLSLLLISALGLGASAQSNNGNGNGKWRDKASQVTQNDQRFEDGMKKAGFTDDQISKMKSANSDYTSKMKAIHDDKALDEKARQSKMQDLNKEKDKKYESIMGKDKYKEYKSKYENAKGDYNDQKNKFTDDKHKHHDRKDGDQQSGQQ